MESGVLPGRPCHVEGNLPTTLHSQLSSLQGVYITGLLSLMS